MNFIILTSECSDSRYIKYTPCDGINKNLHKAVQFNLVY